MNRLCLIVAIALSMALSACAHHAVRESRVQMSYVSFQTLDEAQPRAEAGVLRLPIGIDHRVPAVVIVHGSAGVDSRGSGYAAVASPSVHAPTLATPHRHHLRRMPYDVHPARTDSKYYSSACRQRAYRNRRRPPPSTARVAARSCE